MRYAKGGLVINPERDIPLLRQVRNSRFVSHSQLFELMRFGGSDRSRDSFNWRVERLSLVTSASVVESFAQGRQYTGSPEKALSCSNIMASSPTSYIRIHNTFLTPPRCFTPLN